MHPHDPEMIEAKAGCFEDAQDLNGRPSCFRLKLPAGGQPPEDAQSPTDIETTRDAIQTGKFGQQFLPHRHRLVFSAAQRAVPRPSDRLEQSRQRHGPLTRGLQGRQSGPSLAPPRKIGDEFRAREPSCRAAAEAEERHHVQPGLPGPAENCIEKRATRAFPGRTLNKRRPQQTAGRIDADVVRVHLENRQRRIDDRIVRQRRTQGNVESAFRVVVGRQGARRMKLFGEDALDGAPVLSEVRHDDPDATVGGRSFFDLPARPASRSADLGLPIDQRDARSLGGRRVVGPLFDPDTSRPKAREQKLVGRGQLDETSDDKPVEGCDAPLVDPISDELGEKCPGQPAVLLGPLEETTDPATERLAVIRIVPLGCVERQSPRAGQLPGIHRRIRRGAHVEQLASFDRSANDVFPDCSLLGRAEQLDRAQLCSRIQPVPPEADEPRPEGQNVRIPPRPAPLGNASTVVLSPKLLSGQPARRRDDRRPGLLGVDSISLR